jgi:hypothetical protein
MEQGMRSRKREREREREFTSLSVTYTLALPPFTTTAASAMRRWVRRSSLNGTLGQTFESE